MPYDYDSYREPLDWKLIGITLAALFAPSLVIGIAVLFGG